MAREQQMPIPNLVQSVQRSAKQGWGELEQARNLDVGELWG